MMVHTTGYLYQKDVTVSKKIILTTNTATADPVTTNAITEADAENSSMVEPDSGEQEQKQSEYDSSSDEETTEDLPEESDNLGNIHLSRDVAFLV